MLTSLPVSIYDPPRLQILRFAIITQCSRILTTPPLCENHMTEAPLPHPSVFLGQQRLKVIRGYRVHEQRTPSQDIHVITPSQTIGPFFGVGLVRPGDEDLACKQPRGARAEGTPIIIQGQVMDENGKPVRKALIEVWQANRWGRHDAGAAGPELQGVGSCADRLAGALYLPLHQAGCVSQPGLRQLDATAARAFLPVRGRADAAPHYADVLPRRGVQRY